MLTLSFLVIIICISLSIYAEIADNTIQNSNLNSNSHFKKLIKSFLEEHKSQKSYKSFLFPFIESKSLQGNESHVQGMIAHWLLENGFQVDEYTFHDLGSKLFDNPNFNSPRKEFHKSPIIVGTIGGKSLQNEVDITGASQSPYKSLILNGHVDVVPIESEDQFIPYESEGRIYGRGSTDMKGGIYSSILAIESILKGLKKKPIGKLIFESVVEEESGGSGSLSTVLRGYTADAAIIPEPSQMKIFPKQQGSMWFNITVYGLAAHGASRYNGVSAVEKGMKVIEKLLDLEQIRNIELKKIEPMSRDLPIPVPINVGMIQGGKWPSSVPDYLELRGRMGVIPGEGIEKARQILRDAMKELENVDEWFKSHPVKVEFYGASWPPGDVSTNSQVVQLLSKVFEDVMQEKPIVGFAPWATDAGYLNTQGAVDAIVFGPGETAKAHQMDENIEIEKIYQCAETIAHFIVDWCGLEDL